MRSIIAAFVLFLIIGVNGQVSHIFQNVQAADADKVNENFEYVLENASSDCSGQPFTIPGLRMTYSIPQTMRAITLLPISPTSTTSLRCPSKSWQVDRTLKVMGTVR